MTKNTIPFRPLIVYQNLILKTKKAVQAEYSEKFPFLLIPFALAGNHLYNIRWRS
jgi:hypothetical protein